MLDPCLVVVLATVGLAVTMHACATTSPQRLIDQARSCAPGTVLHPAGSGAERAKDWEFMAEFYEKHPEPDPQISAQHAVHCRAIAQNYRKAADEARTLATDHAATTPAWRVGS